MRPRFFSRWTLAFLLAWLLPVGGSAQTTWLGAGTTLGAGVTIGQFVPVVPTLPTPPSYATHFNNLQIQGGSNPNNWGVNTSQSGSTGTCSTCSGAMTFGVASPSLSGAAMRIDCTSTSTTSGFYWNCLFNRHLGTAMVSGIFPPTHFETDVWVYFVAAQNVQCYEYDPDLYHSGGEYFMSWQLCVNGSDPTHLHLYSKIAPGWKTSAFPRPSITPGVWHHMQTYGTMDPTKTSTYPYGSYTYVDFIWDSVYVYHNLNQTYGAGPTTFGENTNLEMQLDSPKPVGGVAPGAITEFLDKYGAIFW